MISGSTRICPRRFAHRRQVHTHACLPQPSGCCDHIPLPICQHPLLAGLNTLIRPSHRCTAASAEPTPAACGSCTHASAPHSSRGRAGAWQRTDAESGGPQPCAGAALRAAPRTLPRHPPLGGLAGQRVPHTVLPNVRPSSAPHPLPLSHDSEPIPHQVTIPRTHHPPPPCQQQPLPSVLFPCAVGASLRTSVPAWCPTAPWTDEAPAAPGPLCEPQACGFGHGRGSGRLPHLRRKPQIAAAVGLQSCRSCYRTGSRRNRGLRRMCRRARKGWARVGRHSVWAHTAGCGAAGAAQVRVPMGAYYAPPWAAAAGTFATLRRSVRWVSRSSISCQLTGTMALPGVRGWGVGGPGWGEQFGDTGGRTVPAPAGAH